MKKWEIINPSDAYTCEGDDPSIVMAALLLLGDGHYGAREISVENPRRYLFSPIFGSVMNMYRKEFGVEIEDVCDERMDEIVAVLDSVKLSGGEQTSLNDIGGRAHRMVAAYRAKQVTAPLLAATAPGAQEDEGNE